VKLGVYLSIKSNPDQVNYLVVYLLHTAPHISRFSLQMFILSFVICKNAVNYGEGAQIKLDSNGLTNLDAAVFRPIIAAFKENRLSTAFISASNSKKTIEILLVHE